MGKQVSGHMFSDPGFLRTPACCFPINKLSLLISTNQQSPKYVDPAVQEYYWRFMKKFFSSPHTNEKSIMGVRLSPIGNNSLSSCGSSI